MKEDKPMRLNRWPWICPKHKVSMIILKDKLICPQQCIYTSTNGILDFMSKEENQFLQPFITTYDHIRHREGRGSTDPEYYQSLPFRDTSGNNQKEWSIRAKSYQTFLRKVLIPYEKSCNRTLWIADMGAGNGWFAYRMSTRKHHVLAIDIRTDSRDGLGAHHNYPGAFIPIRTRFENIPIDDHFLDLIVFNASFHYSSNYEAVLMECCRILRQDGILAIIDSPLFKLESSGRQMLEEQARSFEKKFGLRPPSIEMEGFLTYERVMNLGWSFGLKWSLYKPYYGIPWMIQPLRSRIQGRREPARFIILAGSPITNMETSSRDFPSANENATQSKFSPHKGIEQFQPYRWGIGKRIFRRALMQPLTKLRFAVYLIFQSRHRFHPVKTRWKGLTVTLLPGVFHPKIFRSGFFLADTLEEYPMERMRVLDMGTGSGILAIVSARRGAIVDAVDIHSDAIQCAKANIEALGLALHIRLLQGDLFQPLKNETYDIIVSNPPFFRDSIPYLNEFAWGSPNFFERFFHESTHHLKPTGSILMVLSDRTPLFDILLTARRNGYEAKPVKLKRFLTETLVVYQFKLSHGLRSHTIITKDMRVIHADSLQSSVK